MYRYGVVKGRVLVADDHPLVREGVTLALRSTWPEWEIDAAGDISQAEDFLRRNTGYKLILLDFVLPDARGFSGFLGIQHLAPTVPIVMLSASQRPALFTAAKALGAAAYLSKALPLDQLVAAIRRVLAGERIFPPEESASAQAAETRERISELSGAQLRVLLALANGRLNKQIAGDLGVTEATIKAHMSAIFRKLGVNNRTQAILAMQPLLGEAEKEPS